MAQVRAKVTISTWQVAFTCRLCTEFTAFSGTNLQGFKQATERMNVGLCDACLSKERTA
jgi:hypothetical protein